jgi:hypothetical protein
MAKPNQITTLRVEDFAADQRAWLPRLFTPLNQFLTSTYNVLNGRVEFGSNVPCLDLNLNFSYGGSAQSFTWNLNEAPLILWVGQATEDGAPIALQPSWVYNSSTKMVSVNFFKLDGTALSVGSLYKVFVRAVP